jgi:lipid A 3-O-deacylase
MLFRALFTLLIITMAISVEAQEIDNTASYRHLGSDHYLRFNLEDDYPLGTDDQYSGGGSFEYVSPKLKKWPLTKVLWRPRWSATLYSIAGETELYTPTFQKQEVAGIQRPYASVLFLKSSTTSIDAVRRRRLSSNLSLGVIGSGAMGDILQRGVHEVMCNPYPGGWDHQIHNDLILNYEVNYEQQLLHYGNALSLDAVLKARGGTLSDLAGIGITLMAGHFVSPYDLSFGSWERLHWYFYARPMLNIVRYDATLQGGMLNRTSPYVLDASEISRIQFNPRAGMVVTYGRVTAEYFLAQVSQQYKSGPIHTWNGIQLALTF